MPVNRKAGFLLRHSKLPSLKLRRAQHESRHDPQIHLLHRIIQFRLHYLRILQLFLERIHGPRRSLASQKQ